MKKIITILAACFIISIKLSATDHKKIHKDTIYRFTCKSFNKDSFDTAYRLDKPKDSAGHHHSFIFGKEKAGKVCMNGLEKLEVAGSTDKSLLFVNQLHFYAPWLLEGRLFMQAEQERNSKTPVHFFEATVDLTIGEFPLHLGYTMGLDQIAKRPNTTYSGPSATVYWSDIPLVHKRFHILRTGVSYLTLSEHLQTHTFEDSTVSRGKELEYSGFLQLQPFHITHNLSVFSEGLFRMRGHNNFAEFEIGLRHSKVLEDLVGLGVRLGWEDFRLHSISAVIRFNISNPNPKHESGSNSKNKKRSNA